MHMFRRRINEIEVTDEVENFKAERKKRKRKKKDDSVSEEIPGLDSALTAQMMQQFFQMEQVLSYLFHLYN